MADSPNFAKGQTGDGQPSQSPPPVPEKQEEINLRLTGDKLKRELDEMNRPYWQQLLRNPQSLTALIGTIGAIFAFCLLIQQKTFENRDLLNRAQAENTKLLKTQAEKEKSAADDEIRNAEAAIKTADDAVKVKTDAAAEEIAKAAEAKKTADDEIAAEEVRAAAQVDAARKAANQSIALAKAQGESVELAFKAERATAIFTRKPSEEHEGPLPDPPITELDKLRSQAIQAWRVAPTPEARRAVAAAYSLPTAILGTLNSNTARTAAYSPSGERILTAEDKGVRVWNARSGKFLKELDSRAPGKEEPDSAESVQVSPNGDFIVAELEAYGLNKMIRVWDAQSGSILASRPEGGYLKPAVSPEGRRIASIDADGTISVWNARAPTQTVLMRGSGSIKGIDGSKARLDILQFSPDEKANLLTAIGTDAVVHIWDAGTGVELRSLQAHQESSPKPVMSLEPEMKVAFSSDGKKVVDSGSYDGTAVVWDSASGHKICTIRATQGSRFETAVFSPDKGSSLVLTASSDGTAEIWGPKCEALRPLIESHATAAAVFSSTGTRVLTLSGDGIVRVWDSQTGIQLAELNARCSLPLQDAAFSPDGTHVVSTDNICPAVIYTVVPVSEVDEFLHR